MQDYLKIFFSGDGYECRELVDDCRYGYPICHKYASCIQQNDSRHTCKCNDGFVGDGVRQCSNNHQYMCLQMCSPFAECQLNNGVINCTCKPPFIGKLEKLNNQFPLLQF